MNARNILGMAMDDRSHGDEATAESARMIVDRLLASGFDIDRKLSDQEQANLESEIEQIAKPIRDEL